MKLLKNIFFLLVFLATPLFFSCKKDNQSPTIAIMSPGNNLFVQNDTTLNIVLNPADPDGDISRVDLFINDSLRKSFSAPPYQYEWTNVKEGNYPEYVVKAVVVDDEGALGEAKMTVQSSDFREKYFGEFSFTVITSVGGLPQAERRDTAYHSGPVRAALPSERQKYVSPWNQERTEYEKITLEFIENYFFTTVMENDGNFVQENNGANFQNGNFLNSDSVFFEYLSGGMEVQTHVEVIGIREE